MVHEKFPPLSSQSSTIVILRTFPAAPTNLRAFEPHNKGNCDCNLRGPVERSAEMRGWHPAARA